MLCKHNWLLLEARLEKSVHLWHGLIALYILGPAPCMVVEAMGTITFAARRTLDGVLNSIVVHKSRELEGLRGELEAARELRGREEGASLAVLREKLEAEQAAHTQCRVRLAHLSLFVVFAAMGIVGMAWI